MNKLKQLIKKNKRNIIGLLIAGLFLLTVFKIVDSHMEKLSIEKSKNTDAKVENVLSTVEYENYKGYLQKESKTFSQANYIEYGFYEKKLTEKQLSEKLYNKENPLELYKIYGENSDSLKRVLINKTNKQYDIKVLKLGPDYRIVYQVDDYKISDKKLKELIIEIYEFNKR